MALLACLASPPIVGAQTIAPPKVDVPIDRETPRASFEGFQRALRASDHARAAQFLDLGALPRAKRDTAGPDLARDLGLVLGWGLVLDPAQLSEDPGGDPDDGPASDLIGTITVDDQPVPISLTRVKRPDGTQAWLFSRTTVAQIPAMYAAHGQRWLGDRVPEPLRKTSLLGLAAWQWMGLLVAFVLSYAGGYVGGTVLAALLAWFARRSKIDWDDRMVATSRGPLRLLLGVGVLGALVPMLGLDAGPQRLIDGASNGALILALAWLVLRGIDLGASSLEGRLPEDTVGELRTRGLRTQLGIIRRIASVLVGVVAAAAVLTQFEIVRTFGTSLLASAGIAGIVLGIAAQKTLGGVFAGVQVAVAQSVRIGDAVVIEKEFGTIEEINLTYVVVRLWDDRRLIVPTSRFLEQPFENWTRMGNAILGSVHLPADYTTPVAAVRAELERICAASPDWDGRVCKLIVADATDRTIQLRALVSAANHTRCFDLRCDVREQLVGFLQRLDGGAHLPRQRNELAATPDR